MRQKTKRWWLTVLVLLALGGGAYYAKQQWFTPNTAPTYATAAVVRGNVEKSVLASGKLEAFQQVSVGAQVSGQVKHLAVELGQNVKAGDLIAEIDSLTQQNALRNAEAALTTAKAELASQQATLAQVKANYERQKQLRAADASSRAEFEAAEQSYKVAQASIQSQKARIAQAEIAQDTAQLNLGYTRIVAPMDGQVVAIVTKEGQTVNANQSAPTIIILAQLDTMTIKAEISEADVTRVKPGQPVYFTILGEPDKRYDATLRSIEPAPESISSTSTASSTNANSTSTAIYYNGLFDVPNPDHSLRISMTAQVYIVQGAAKDVLTVPASALGRKGPDGNYMVRVVGPDGKVTPTRVEVGINNNITAQVMSGLSEGDRVVISDSSGASAARTPGARPGPGGPGMRM
ncbi:efflux RND transporter periplasmic adaptor subunit [Lampropedia puyangensis]|uniref:Efflux RND transporter periplasmic adaptor subunit n=1 Tax=Lampropedia puyangensis TaxID=1330072 RepID=A0A4S8EZH6_9BURK|nr:efflux RND transporter periplasmic adaptor subunit [Lampropedia puyangensis]THT98251.1 efflux RND transporter periplasmic adaptor subunit [Lampropedia puyangensis]